uniref:Serpentine receptor class gamma n=1 Tax=Strongyloides stercoralis TaxID=6248 RepID=A0A0K0ETP8_STRER
MLNGILDLIFIVEEYITFRIPQAGFFEHFYINIFSKYLISGMCYTYSVVQGIYISLSGITITFNRYIAIKYHTKYSYLWSGWRLILLSIWPLIISVCIFVIFHKIEVEYTLTDIGVISVQYKDLETNNLIFKIRLIIYLFALCINIILNVILLYTKKKKNNLAIINKNIKKREMKLEVTMAKFAILYCSFLTLLVCVEIGMIVAVITKAIIVAEILLTSYVFIESVMVFFISYTLLYLSYDFRRKFLLFIGYSKLWFFGIKSKTLVKTIKIPANVIKSKFSSSRS